MKQKSGPDKAPAEQVLKNIRRQTRRQYSAEEKIRIVLEGLAGANRPNLTFCSVADMSLKMERHRQRTQPFWKSPLHVLGIVICLCLGFTFLAYWSGQKASSNASNGAWSNHTDF